MVTFSFGNQTVTLRDPDFDNVEKLELAKVNQRSRGGDLFIYRDPMWPVTKTLDMKFSYLTESQVQSLLRFVDLSLGQIVTHVDFEGRLWSGVITTPAGEIAQPGRENHTAHIAFQGDLV